MKVLKEGKWTVPWSKELTCSESSCSATLLVEESDVAAPDCYGNENKLYEFKCPVCGKKTSIPHKDLPLRVKETLDTKRKVYPVSSGWGD